MTDHATPSETAALIAGILARAAAATPGPWRHIQVVPDYSQVESDATPSALALIGVSPADGEFIAHAREDIPALLAALEDAQADLAARDEVIAEALAECLRAYVPVRADWNPADEALAHVHDDEKPGRVSAILANAPADALAAHDAKVRADTLEELLLPESLEAARSRVEDELIEWRDSRIFVPRRNGLVVFEVDGTPSAIIRMGFETAFELVIRERAAAIRALTSPTQSGDPR